MTETGSVGRNGHLRAVREVVCRRSLPASWQRSGVRRTVAKASVWTCAAVVAVSATAAGSAQAQVAEIPAVGTSTNDGVAALSLGSGNVLYASGEYERLAMRSGRSARFDGSGARDGVA